MIGTVDSGCVEAEVWTAAREVIEIDTQRRLNFSLGEDAAYDNGLPAHRSQARHESSNYSQKS